jgi:hypothetical protein
MREMSEVPDVAQFVDDASDVQSAQEVRTGRQRPEPLLHHRSDQKLGPRTLHAGTVETDEVRHATINVPTPGQDIANGREPHKEPCAKDRTSR